MVAVALLVSTTLGLLFTDSARVFSNLTTRSLPIHSVELTDNKIALTFDASWGAGRTQSLVDTLHAHNVPATFFVTGAWAERHSELFKTLADDALIEIGSHSNTHPHMTRLSRREIDLEIQTSVSVIENLSGIRPTLFRAPYGEFSDALLNAASSSNLTSIQWDVDAMDWQNISSYDITTRVLAQAGAGSIVRLHNDGRNTPEALGAIISGFINRGFTFTSISDMIFSENYTIDQTGRQQKRG